MRQLDDNVYLGPVMTAWRFYNAFCNIASECNIRLAPNEHGKAFQPSDEGDILGIFYCVPEWTMRLEEKKLSPILRLLYTVVDADWVENDTVMSLNGKLR